MPNFLILMSEKGNTSHSNRNSSGFTLMFAVILSVVFSSLLYMVFYFLKKNTTTAPDGIFKLQTIYLAESGNNRALSMLNVKTLPEIDIEGLEELGDDFDDEDFEDDFDDDFFDDEDDDFFDDDDDFDDDFEDDFDEEDQLFLSKIPRYINFFHEFPFFVNVNTGSIVSYSQYHALIAQQEQRIQENKRIARENGLEYDTSQEEIPVQEIYFPLPEVNVKQIGSFLVKRGTHLKPGYKILVAEKLPMQIKQKNIIEEFYNYVPDFESYKAKPKLYSISPNYAYPGDYLDIYLDGEDIEDIKPGFSTGDIGVLEANRGVIGIAVSEKAKPGRYIMKASPVNAEFYVVPIETTDFDPPIIGTVKSPKLVNGSNDFIKISSKEKITGIKITGEFLSTAGQKPMIVPDAKDIRIEITSYGPEEIVFNIETKRAAEGEHYFTVFTEGGQSSGWFFNIEKRSELDQEDPYIGSFTTLLTLLEVQSLPNLPLKSYVSTQSSSGRPSSGADSGRPGGNQAQNGRAQNKSFDLLRSDLATVWKLETIAKINKKIYKETKIIRRSAPRVDAAFVANTSLSFGQNDMIISGELEATTILTETVSSEDSIITVEGEDPDDSLFDRDDDLDNQIPTITGEAVIENLGIGVQGASPASRGFTEASIVAITDTRGGSRYTDYSYITELGSNTITVDPPFRDGHFIGDQVSQFIPAVVTPNPIGERDSRRNLDPPGAYVRQDGKETFEYVFRTRLDKIADWSNARTTNTKIPEDFELDYEGYIGLTVIEGVPNYSGVNALYGQGTLIVDTTRGGTNPLGATVTIGGSSKLPSIFSGVVYIIGDLQITGPVDITGGIVVNSPVTGKTCRIGGRGSINYNEFAINSGILGIPFAEEPRTRILEKAKSQDDLLKGLEKK